MNEQNITNTATNNTAKTLALHSETYTFNRPSDGKSVSYTNYYVEIMDIIVKLILLWQTISDLRRIPTAQSPLSKA